MFDISNMLILFIVLTISVDECACFKEWWEDSKVNHIINVFNILVLELTNENFDSYVGNSTYVIVEFYTKWCRYCKDLAKDYERLYEHYLTNRKDVLITRLEGGANDAILARYGIQSFPIIAMFIPGDRRIKKVFQGPRTFERFDEWIRILCPVIEIKENVKEDKIESSNSNNRTGNNSESELDKMKQELENMKMEFNEINKTLTEAKEKMNNLRYSNDNNNISKGNGNKVVIEIDFSLSSLLKFIIFISIIIAIIFTAKKLIYYNYTKKDKIYDR